MQHQRLQRNPRGSVLLICAAAAVLLAGCATSSSDQSAEPREDKVYRTGSNLPQRDYPSPGDVKTLTPSTVTRPARGLGSPTTGGGG